jgi:hypothetical protein
MTVTPGGSAPPPPADERSAASQRELLAALNEVTCALPEEGAGQATAAKKQTGPRRSWLLLIALVGVLLLVIVRTPLGSPDPTYEPVPEAFLGTWTSAAERYADRGFVITSDTLWLRLGEEQSIAYPILGVNRNRNADSSLFTFHYRDGASSLQLGLRMSRDSTVHLANLPTVDWKKEPR